VYDKGSNAISEGYSVSSSMLKRLVISLRLADTSGYHGRDFINGRRLMPSMERKV
jgi:hypothetical protein